MVGITDADTVSSGAFTLVIIQNSVSNGDTLTQQTWRLML